MSWYDTLVASMYFDEFSQYASKTSALPVQPKNEKMSMGFFKLIIGMKTDDHSNTWSGLRSFLNTIGASRKRPHSASRWCNS